MRKLFLGAVLALLAPAGAALAQIPPPGEIMSMMDTDKDGGISKGEWSAAGRPTERFDLIDRNKDGKITLPELEAAMAAMQRGGR